MRVEDEDDGMCRETQRYSRETGTAAGGRFIMRLVSPDLTEWH